MDRLYFFVLSFVVSRRPVAGGLRIDQDWIGSALCEHLCFWEMIDEYKCRVFVSDVSTS